MLVDRSVPGRASISKIASRRKPPNPALFSETTKKTGLSGGSIVASLKASAIFGFAKLRGTTLDKAGELDALANLEKTNPNAAADLKARTTAGQEVSARALENELTTLQQRGHSATREETLSLARRQFTELHKALTSWRGNYGRFPEFSEAAEVVDKLVSFKFRVVEI